MGPLKSVKIIEVGGIGPGPLCGMFLSDMGAEILRVDRLGYEGLFPLDTKYDPLMRNRKSVRMDLSRPEGIE
ncbi:MAG: CoA transferase, partial [Thermodesulfobacteriota bacterium]|nr:CoA transferase [Thermodesulfobacteriota bacterium]